jgi:hypothetical protein
MRYTTARPASPRADPLLRRRWGRWSLAKQAQRKRKRRRAPPWGDLLDGKPIERDRYYVRLPGKKTDLIADARQMQYIKMLRLAKYYGVPGGPPLHLIGGIGDPVLQPWYQLALKLALELDESLRIVDAPKTAPRWRGFGGVVLLDIVDGLQKAKPGQPIRWYLHRLQTKNPDSYGRMSLDQLDVRYHEAKRRHRTTK